MHACPKPMQHLLAKVHSHLNGLSVGPVSDDARIVLNTYEYDGPSRAFPLLPSLTTRALGTSTKADIPVSAAYLACNLASEILDDAFDSTCTNRPWTRWSQGRVAMAVLDLIWISQASLARLDVSQAAHQDILHAFAETGLLALEGQRQSLTPIRTLDEYWAQATKKSGAVFGLGVWAGARLLTDDPLLLSSCLKFGIRLGILSQITDDIADFVAGSEEVAVRGPELDTSLPVVAALTTKGSPTKDLAYLLGLPSEGRDATWASALRELVDTLGGMAQSLVLARTYQDECHQLLTKLATKPTPELHAFIDSHSTHFGIQSFGP